MNKRTRTTIPSRTPYLFLAPFLTAFAVFTFYPLILSVWLTTRQTFGPGYSHGVGLGNFASMLTDDRFWIALRNTGLFAFFTVLLQTPLSLALAMLLNQKWLKGRAFFRLVIFSPTLVGSVFVGIMASIVFQKRTGMVNQLLHWLFNFNPDFPWLTVYLLPAMVVASLWMWTGFNMVYLLAALQNVDRYLLEYAQLDGVSVWQRFRHIIFPEIKPVLGYVVLISLISSFQVFELPYLMLSRLGAGPENRALTIVMYLYQSGFNAGDIGYASTIGWALALILILFSITYRMLSRSERT